MCRCLQCYTDWRAQRITVHQVRTHACSGRLHACASSLFPCCCVLIGEMCQQHFNSTRAAALQQVALRVQYLSSADMARVTHCSWLSDQGDNLLLTAAAAVAQVHSRAPPGACRHNHSKAAAAVPSKPCAALWQSSTAQQEQLHKSSSSRQQQQRLSRQASSLTAQGAPRGSTSSLTFITISSCY
jgi:hypothetical protein